MNRLSKASLTITLSVATLIIAAGSFADEKDPDSSVQADRQALREMKLEHRREINEMRRARHAGRMLKKVDVNQDGKVDMDEYLAHARERFNKLDLDGSGFVTQEEAREAMQKMREEQKTRMKEMRERHNKDSN
ncbi:MAG: hypothetical protein MK188_09750 [Gammaproteobacteria bacterium]|nr:hypothetical protein [Gammaproteobacteria bacterium]